MVMAFLSNSLSLPVLILVLCSSCSGSYSGVDGPGVISRHDAVAEINDAKLLRMSLCGVDSAGAASLYIDYTRHPRKVLDGAYYATRDVDICVQSIYLTPCNQWPRACELSPKEFIEPGYFQGGF